MPFWSEKGRRRWWPGRAAFVSSLLCCSLTLTSLVGQSAGVQAGYFISGMNRFLPVNGLDSTLFTHLLYGYVQWDNTTATLTIAPEFGTEMQTFPKTMKSKNPGVLASISINTSDFSSVLNYQREAFFNASMSLAREYSYDGIDLDWEYPQSQDEMDAFGDFLPQWRKAVQIEADKSKKRPLIISAVVYFNPILLYVGLGVYPAKALGANLDFVNIRTFDYHGPWDPDKTGAVVNLYDRFSKISTDNGLVNWVDAGLPIEKGMLGITVYGRSWQLRDQNNNSGLGAPAIGKGPVQPFSLEAGYMFYFEVVNYIRTYHATVIHDYLSVTVFCFVDNVWISYEDPAVAAHRSMYAKRKGMAGYFLWHVAEDNYFQIAAAAKAAWDNNIIPP